MKKNRWFKYFTVFNRLALAAGFLPSGMVKILGERFTSLSNNHPMGHYLEALFHTGYYYTFIGVMQVLAAILLLIPRTATLGAFLYFPIILNITVLTFSVRFDGSMFTSPLMVLANLYLIFWDYDKWKYILPFHKKPKPVLEISPNKRSDRFPFLFFLGVGMTAISFVIFSVVGYELKPRNTLSECMSQCPDSDDPKACEDFCECIHNEGHPLDDCLEVYEVRDHGSP